MSSLAVHWQAVDCNCFSTEAIIITFSPGPWPHFSCRVNMEGWGRFWQLEQGSYEWYDFCTKILPTFEFLLLLWFLLHLCLLSIYLTSLHVIKSPRTSPYIFAYYKQSNTGDGNGLGMRLTFIISYVCLDYRCRLHVWTLHAQVAIPGTENDAVSLVHWITWSAIWLVNFKLQKTGQWLMISHWGIDRW